MAHLGLAQPFPNGPVPQEISGSISGWPKDLFGLALRCPKDFLFGLA